LIVIILGVLTDSERDLVNQIFKDYNVKLYNISLKILHSEQDAQDAVAQTFLKIMDHIDKIEKIPCHERLPFCVIVVRNISIDIYRQNRKTLPVDSFEEWKDLSATTEDTFFKGHDRELLLNLIKKLSSQERYLLELRLAEDMSYKDIGAILNITEATARKRFQRAFERLKKLYLEEEYVNV
jgi:RNA polymerase sigma-70 factor (ECF subfamily)